MIAIPIFEKEELPPFVKGDKGGFSGLGEIWEHLHNALSPDSGNFFLAKLAMPITKIIYGNAIADPDQ